MTKNYPSVERIRELFFFDKETSSLIYLVAPFRKPHFLGKRAGRIDRRDNCEVVSIDCKTYTLSHIIALHQTGALPPKAPHHTQMTAEYLRSVISYDKETGTFVRLKSSGSMKAGSQADYLAPNGYKYIFLNGKKFMASRLAWLYVHGSWPPRVFRYKDGNKENCAIDNLVHGEWDFTDPVQKRAYDKASRQKKPDQHRNHNLKRDFGMTTEQYQAAFVAQGGVCACCHRPEVSERDGKRKWLAVDHDHKDGTFRGLLCGSCNNMLGRAKDDITVLNRAAAYLEAHAAKPKTNVIPLAGRRIANSKGES